MLEIFSGLLDPSGFPPRWQCGVWSTQLGYLHIVSDILTFLAYLAIPIVLAVYGLRKRHELAFPKVIWLFVAFIFFCGTTHLIEAIIFYQPVYRLSGVFKALTAIVSWGTVIALFYITPKALRLPGMAALNKQLQEEVETRQRFEQDLQYSERRYRSLVELLTHIVWMTNQEGHFVSRQPSWQHYTGQDWADSIGEGWLNAIHPEDRAKIAHRWKQAIQREEPYDAEGRLFHGATQTYRHFRAEALPVRDEQGVIREWIGTITDIEDEWRSENRFRVIMEASSSAMILAARSGKIMLANKPAEALFGYSPEALVKLRIQDLVPQRFRHQYQLQDKRELALEGPIEIGKSHDFFCLRSDGCEIPVEIALTPVDTEEGRLIVGSVVDITERKQAEQDLATRAEELARSNRDLDHFAAIVSHDLRAPLRSITSFSQILQRRLGDDLDGKNRDLFDHLIAGARRMDALITDLLAFSRLKAQSMQLEPVPLAKVVAGVVEMIQDDLTKAGAQVICDELPTIRGDATLLRQIIQNLLTNAIRYRSSEPLRIQLTSQKIGDSWQISIADNGIGIKPEHLTVIFEIFRRVGNNKSISGTGIGLAICQRVIDLHGGKIWAESEPGKGTTFHFTLPAAD